MKKILLTAITLLTMTLILMNTHQVNATGYTMDLVRSNSYSATAAVGSNWNHGYDSLAYFVWFKFTGYPSGQSPRYLLYTGAPSSNGAGLQFMQGKIRIHLRGSSSGSKAKCLAEQPSISTTGVWHFMVGGREVMDECYCTVDGTVTKSNWENTVAGNQDLAPSPTTAEMNAMMDGSIYNLGFARYHAPYNWFKRMTEMRWGGWTHTATTDDWAFIPTGNTSPLSVDYGTMTALTTSSITFGTTGLPTADLGERPASLQPYYAKSTANTQYMFKNNPGKYSSGDTSWTMEAVVRITSQSTTDRLFWGQRDAYVTSLFGQRPNSANSLVFQPFFRYGDAPDSCFRGNIYLTNDKW
eukprot:TRINITY_DN551_c0_g1_i3.p1 TRINITY_DN551_c0_g1~~TRINITY_DN551_c0_g1_i3.p1  ORF type:complete len:354 (+),score=76.45 TRINITY_DN551_c0_g1_i3:86-1147(+)